jgi:hypothetical protein
MRDEPDISERDMVLAEEREQMDREDLAADLDEAFNTLFDELHKLPKEHRTKAFDMLSKTPWFNEAERVR